MSRGGTRAGARLLPMATNPVKRQVLRQLCDRPLRWGPQREARITTTGREMLFVAFVAERWLQGAPGGPLRFEGSEAEGAIAALVEGWSSSVVHVLARQPVTLHELDRAIDGLGTRALKRRLAALRRAGLVEAHPDDGEGCLYAPTDWLRAGVAPLAAAARLERRDPKRETAPIDALDVEAAFQLTLPLLELPAELSGSCRLGVEMGDGERLDLAGATTHVEQGRVTSCAVSLDARTDAWAAASAEDWLDTLIEPDAKRVRMGGDRLLAGALLMRLQSALFGIPVR